MKVQGGDLMLFVDGKSIAYATSHTLNIDGETQDTSNKDEGAGGWASNEVSILSWSATSDNLYSEDGEGNNYEDLFDLMMSLVKMPDLLIYVRASLPTLVAQIQKRARGYEQQIKLDYLQGLNDKYENWIKDYKGKLLIVEGDKIKFGDNPEDFRWITDHIDAELFGLFPFESEEKTGKEI